MTPNPVHRLPAPLEAAVQRLKLAAREAAERTIESLGLAALASTNAFQRDGLLGAQFELNRKSAVFALTFNDAFDQRVLRELSPSGNSAPADPSSGTAAGAGAETGTDWATLTLVEDKEVEARISADRFALEIARACEWELRELEGYVRSLLGEAGGERDRNPLRPDLVGHAMISGIEAVSERAEVRKVLTAELGRSLGALLPTTYADIVSGLRSAGVQPLGMTVRQRPARVGDTAGDDGADTGHGAPGRETTGRGGDDRGTSSRSGLHTGQGIDRGAESRYGSLRSALGSLGPTTRSGLTGRRAGASLGRVDPALMALIRRLADTDLGDGGDVFAAEVSTAPLPHNLIRAHRDELRHAANGTLDHMVIDVIGLLFDQILADPKVPPQMARQIARLQLPVLRAALGDPTFFSSRRHPVRRFVNRIASLGAAFEDFEDDAARDFLAKVKALVQQVVEGDFDQIDIYEQKLAALEAYTVEMAERGTPEQLAAAALLAEKEDQLRLRQLYAQRLAGELKDVPAPPFLREFLSEVWSRVLLRAAEQGGADGALAQRLRGAGRELFLSVQPKATPAHRKAFLAELPKLMQQLTEGMNLIAWPEAPRRAFFGQLMPAHAEALKSEGGRQLDINLMARQVEGALQRPVPSRADLKGARDLPQLLAEEQPPPLSAEEARRVGLVQESSVDWTGPVGASDPAYASEPDAAPDAGPALPGLPATLEPPEPSEGLGLADHVQVGFAYQMHLEGAWQKVRLMHVSSARSFFVFTLGSRHKQTISLTRRMLVRLCETGRLKAHEKSTLLERATARARRELAALGRGSA